MVEPPTDISNMTKISDESVSTVRATAEPDAAPSKKKEIGGQKGPEPTRYGDWEVKGRCTDF